MRVISCSGMHESESDTLATKKNGPTGQSKGRRTVRYVHRFSFSVLKNSAAMSRQGKNSKIIQNVTEQFSIHLSSGL